jgi:hypothetical protein
MRGSAHPLVRLAGQPLRYALNVSKYLVRPRDHDGPRPATVVFDLSANPFQRYLFLLAQFFTLSGFEVAFRYRTRFLAQLGRYSDLILASPHMRLDAAIPSSAELLFTDRPRHGWTVISADYFQPSSPSSFHVPMAMHPNMYRHGWFERCAELSSNGERGTRVLFAGNADATLYSDGTVARVFGKLGRLEILATLDAAFRPQITRQLEGDSSSPESRPTLVVCEASSCYVPQARFLETLSRCTFFVAAPGVAVPMCHNVIEAMSVGAVPILNYAEQFDPPLEHGMNCLAFSTADELTRCVREALSMDDGRVAALRLGASAYYGRHLSPGAVVSSVLGRKDALETLFLNAEQQSVDLLERRAAMPTPP